MKRLTSSLLSLVLLAPSVVADRIGLAGGNLMTGTVRAIDDRGRLVVDSPNAATPLFLRGEALRSIDFDRSAKDAPAHGEALHLTNGDSLPGVVRDIDAEHIDFTCWYAGDLRIPRSAVSSIDFGVAPQPLVFEGPGDEADWQDADDWKFRGATLVSTGLGTISRPKVLPEHFILRFHLSWTTNPNFQFYFCDDHLKDSGEADRYYFDVNASGLHLKRQATGEGKSLHPLHSIKRLPDEFPDKSVEIELRVDRKNRLIYIYADRALEGCYPDLIDQVPTGTGIMLKSASGNEAKNIISSIEVYKWDAISQLHRSEGHEDPTLDAIITTDSERLPGEVQGLVEEDGERVLLLKNPHSDPLFHIPLRRSSVLYFRQGEPPTPSPDAYRIDLAGQGRLQLSGLRLDADKLTGRHTLLGPVRIERDALGRLTAITPDSDE